MPTNYPIANSSTPVSSIGRVSIATDFSEIDVEFNSIENGTPVLVRFEPEQNMTADECMKISMLMMLALGGALSRSEASLGYIRKNNLMRHFKLS